MRRVTWIPAALSLSLLAFVVSGCGARSTPSRATVRAHQQAVLEDVREDVDYVKHEQGNVGSELRRLEGKLSSQETILDSLRREVNDSLNANRQVLSKRLSEFEDRVGLMEKVQADLVGDIRDLKTSANNVAESLAQAKKRINDFEKSIDHQQNDIQNLEGAVRALMAIVQNDSRSRAAQIAGRSYRVKAGDTLDKIARAHHTSTEALKKANNLKSDLIVIDQELVLPE